MIKRGLIIAVLVITVALPFWLRPARPALAPAQDTLVIITPHNEATRYEFGRGFQAWYQARTGRTVSVDWRVVGGTSDIVRYLESEYAAAFERFWTRQPGHAWSAEIQSAFTNPALPTEASAAAREARAAFVASDVSCGIDVFFGGGAYDFVGQAKAGRIVPSRVRQTHPEWFSDRAIPQRFTGEQYWDNEGCWAGNVLSNFGVLYNKEALARLGLPAPGEWSDLADPRYVGEIGVADPTKSSSIAKVFENIIQQQILKACIAQAAKTGQRYGASQTLDALIESRAVGPGWDAGLRLIQLISANARYFTDSSQKPVIDVAQGDCAAGLCIDFYGRAQAEALDKRGAGRLGFVAPRGGTDNSVDPIALLRGAPHREIAELFIEYVLSLDGQKLLNFKPGTPGGPQRYALRRMPVRRDFYEHDEWKPLRSDPDASPFSDPEPLVYHADWTSDLFREMEFATRVMCVDSHAELVAAWRSINHAPEPARKRALEVLQGVVAEDFNLGAFHGPIHQALTSKNKVDEVKLASELGARVRAQYKKAQAIAEGH